MIERKGNQFRVRVLDPKLFNKKTFRTLDVGRPGGLKLVVGRLKGKETTTTQALRLSADDYKVSRGNLVAKTGRGKSELDVISKLLGAANGRRR